MIHIKSFTFNPFMENTYVLYDDSGEGVVIDPGCYSKEEKATLQRFIDDQGIKVVKLLNTHCHLDHVLGNRFVHDTYNVKLYIHQDDEPVLQAGKVFAESMGFPDYEPVQPDAYIKEGDVITFGNSQLGTLLVPGHAPGHVAFYNQEQNICIGGDVLFQGSIGRTDFPGCDFNTLIDSIHKKIFPLGDNMHIYPGHGPITTVGEEKQSNPFCALTT